MGIQIRFEKVTIDNFKCYIIGWIWIVINEEVSSEFSLTICSLIFSFFMGADKCSLASIMCISFSYEYLIFMQIFYECFSTNYLCISLSQVNLKCYELFCNAYLCKSVLDGV